MAPFLFLLGSKGPRPFAGLRGRAPYPSLVFNQLASFLVDRFHGKRHLATVVCAQAEDVDGIAFVYDVGGFVHTLIFEV